MFPSNLFPQHSGNPIEKSKQKGCKRQRGWRTPSRQIPPNQHDPSSYELTGTGVAFTGPDWICTSWGPRTERRCGKMSTTLIQKPSSLIITCKWNFHFLQGILLKETNYSWGQGACPAIVSQQKMSSRASLEVHCLIISGQAFVVSSSWEGIWVC